MIKEKIVKRPLITTIFFIIWIAVGCSSNRGEPPSIESLFDGNELINNNVYQGWYISVRDESYLIGHVGKDTIMGTIKDTLFLNSYPEGGFDSSYNVACSLYEGLSLMANKLNAKIESYINVDSSGQFLFARMDFYNKDYDTIYTLFQIDSLLYNCRIVNNKNIKPLVPLTKDWYTISAFSSL